MNKLQTNERNQSYKYVSRIVGFLWAFLTACFAILNIFIFVQPHWIGDTLLSPRAGHFGLYSYCISRDSDYELDCQGTWTNFGTILNAPFAVATLFIGLSALLILVCLAFFITFLFLNSRTVFFTSATIQMTCGICLFIGLITYPSGFDHEKIRMVCGQNVNEFNIDTCQIRWAYIMGIIAFVNILVLAILGFVLGMKEPDIEKIRRARRQQNMISNYGELNDAYDDRTYSEETMQRR